MANVGTLFSGEVTIYHHNGGTTYYCRFKNRSGGSGYIKKSLKTKDYAEAFARAKTMYLKHIALVESGFDPTELNWDQAVKLYSERMDQGQPRSFLIQINKTYFTKFFSQKFKSLRDIASSDIIDYFRWRANFWEREYKNKSKPALLNCVDVASPATMVKERRFLGLIFKGLFNDRKINRMPDMPTTRRLTRIAANLGRANVDTRSRRPKFSPAEYKAIRLHLAERVVAVDGWKPSVQLLSAKRLILWCDLIARTGIRPQELRRVKFNDFEDIIINDGIATEKDSVVIKDGEGHIVNDHAGYIRGRVRIRREVAKTKRLRYAADINEGGFSTALKDWKDLNAKVLGYQMSMDDLVFPAKRWRSDSDEKWSIPMDMSASVKKMLRKAGLWEIIDEDGNKLRRSSYSLRAMFITQRIKEGIKTRFIAENCGTSEQMIDRFYDGSDGTNFFDCLNVRHQNRPDSD